MLLRLAAAALAFVAGSTLWAATSMFEGNTARADGPGLLGGDDSGSLLGGLAGGEEGLLDTVGSLPAAVEQLTTPPPQASPPQQAAKPQPVLDIAPLLAGPGGERATPLGAVGSALQPTLQAATPILESAVEIVDSNLGSPAVQSVLQTVDPVVDEVRRAADPVLEPLAPITGPLGPLSEEGSLAAPILDTIGFTLDGEKPQNPAIPGGDPKAPESPVPAPEQPSTPAKPSANPALPSSSAPIRHSVIDAPTGPVRPTERIANPGPSRAPAGPLDASSSVVSPEAGFALASPLAGDAGSDQTAILTTAASWGTAGSAPIDLHGSHAMTGASGMASTFSSSAGAFAVLAMALAAGILALLSRRLNLEWLVPPSMAWAPEVPPAR